MRNIEYYYFKGKSSWSRVQQPDLEYQCWSIRVHLDNASLEQFRQLKEKRGEVDGILNELKRDEDGDYANFRRPMYKRWGGHETPLTAPIVLDKNNQPINDGIGNGSDVTVKVERYTFNKPLKRGQGSAIRLISVRVDNLVPYQRSDMPEDHAKMIEGMDQQPTEHF